MHVVDPDSLSDQQWAEEIQNLHFIRKQEEAFSQANIKT
jgi:hypothetical protein